MRHDHIFDEESGTRYQCPDGECWWNEPDGPLPEGPVFPSMAEVVAAQEAAWDAMSAPAEVYDPAEQAARQTEAGYARGQAHRLEADEKLLAESDAYQPDFPQDFQGPGPMYAAVPLGEPWYQAASRGATTYILESPYPTDPELGEEAAVAFHQRYAGDSAFLDRDQTEQAADARDGTFVRYEGLTGWNDWTAKADAQLREADAATEAYLASPPEAGA